MCHRPLAPAEPHLIFPTHPTMRHFFPHALPCCHNLSRSNFHLQISSSTRLRPTHKAKDLTRPSQNAIPRNSPRMAHAINPPSPGTTNNHTHNHKIHNFTPHQTQIQTQEIKIQAQRHLPTSLNPLGPPSHRCHHRSTRNLNTENIRSSFRRNTQIRDHESSRSVAVNTDIGTIGETDGWIAGDEG